MGFDNAFAKLKNWCFPDVGCEIISILSLNNPNPTSSPASSIVNANDAAELAASLAFTILEAGDEVGFGLFNDKMDIISHPTSGKHQFFSLAKALSNPINYG